MNANGNREGGWDADFLRGDLRLLSKKRRLCSLPSDAVGPGVGRSAAGRRVFVGVLALFLLVEHAATYGEAGLSAHYLPSDVTVAEGPINHGWNRSCTTTNYNQYQNECTSLAESPVDWADGTGYTVEWTGYIYAPVNGEYTFRGWQDGTVYLSINGTVLWNQAATGQHVIGVITLSGNGWYPLTMTFAPNGGSNNLALNWIRPGAGTAELVPRNMLNTNDPATPVEYAFKRMWPTLQQPWYFNSPQGISVDPHGSVYVVDPLKSEVRKFTTDGHFLTKWGNDELFYLPNGVAADSEGNVYVADTYNNRIQKFDSQGQFLHRWGAVGGGAGFFSYPRGVATDAIDNVYVADTGNDRIQKFDATGEYLGEWGATGPVGICVGPDNNVYVADRSNHRIQKFDSDGEFLLQIGSFGFGDGGLNAPTAVSVDDSGNIYVSDTNNNRVQKFNAVGEYVTQWGGSGSGEAFVGTSEGIVVFDTGQVFVTSSSQDAVFKFDTSGVLLSKWSARGSFNQPEAIAATASGDITYVASTGDHTILKFNSSGSLVAAWGEYGNLNSQFDNPYGIAAASDGSVYVADTYNSRIQKFDSDGSYILKWSIPSPRGVATDSLSKVYVTDSSNNRVVKYDNLGGYIKHWSIPGTPWGIAVDSADNVYVADTTNRRVQKYDSEGGYLTQWGGVYGDGEGEFSAIRHLAVDGSNRVYVADLANDRIQVFDSSGLFLKTWGRTGSEIGQMDGPAGVAIGSSGDVYVSEMVNDRVQVFKAVAALPSSKAIVVSAGGAFAGNNLWDATQLCANFAYRTLEYQGFTEARIQYLSSELDLDTVDADATNTNLQNALTSWATDAEDVVVYLVDHGGASTFRMSGTETLNASALDGWLDTLEASISGTLTVIYDACESGTFQSVLAPTSGQQRIVVTSTSPGESAHFLSQGSVSFSTFFWTHVFNGATVLEAFDLAVEGMGQAIDLQTPVLADSPGNKTLAAATYIGNGTEIVGDAPVIGGHSAPQAIVGTSTATIHADPVTDGDGIARVWAVLQPPDFVPASTTNPVQDLPNFDLHPVGGGRYEASYSGFNATGLYQVAIYARDRIGNTSSPKLTTVAVDSPLRRKAVIAVGGTGAHSQWSSFENAAQRAYDALKQQQYSDDDIAFRSPVSFDAGVDGAPSLSGLNYYLTTWGTFDTYDLVLYLVGPASSGSFELGTGEYLDPVTLDGWLDILQTTIPGKVCVVMDANYSGSFVPDLTPPLNRERIVCTSTGSTESARFGSGGDVSFSAYFWTQVLNGVRVRSAFRYAQNSMRFSGGGQMAVINDNGNAVGNEKIDGLVAKDYAIGAGIQLAGDAPVIGSIGATPDTLAVSTSSTIWVEGVTSTGTIDAVTATVLPPGHEVGDPLPEFSLAYVSGSRYEGSYAGFDRFGAYEVAVVARDSEGQTSAPLTVTVTQTDAADVYEPDDSSGAAGWFDLDGVPQTHNFHANANEDWVKFFAHAGDIVSLETFDLGIASDTYLTIYQGSGLTFVGEDDDGSPTETWGSYYEFAAVATDYYYVKVHFPENPSFPQRYGPDTEYSLRIFRPIGPCLESGTLYVYVHAGSLSGPGVTGATVTITELANPGFPQEKFSGVGGEVQFGFSAAGSHEIQVSKTGYGSPSPVTQSLSCDQEADVDVVLQPEAGVDPMLQVTPGGWEFGSVAVGNQVEKVFSVTNAGGGTLTGSVSTASPFSVVLGGSYSLGAGQNQSVTMRFTPGAAQGYNGQASFTGGGGATVALSGTGFSGATGVIGDVNADESIDALDATLINLYILLGYDLETINAQLLSVGLNPMLPSLADVDRTGGTTSRDATLISVELLMGKAALNGYLSTRSPALPISHAGEPLP